MKNVVSIAFYMVMLNCSVFLQAQSVYQTMYTACLGKNEKDTCFYAVGGLESARGACYTVQGTYSLVDSLGTKMGLLLIFVSADKVCK